MNQSNHSAFVRQSKQGLSFYSAVLIVDLLSGNNNRDVLGSTGSQHSPVVLLGIGTSVTKASPVIIFFDTRKKSDKRFFPCNSHSQEI